MAEAGPAGAPAALRAGPATGDVAVVVVLHNGAPWIERCLRSVESASRRVHLIVVDNASQDDGPARVRASFPAATVLSMGANLGFGRGNNVGIRAALARGCQQVLLLNQDAWLAHGSLDLLADLLDDEPDFGVVSPLHCTADFSELDPHTTTHYLRPYAAAYLSDLALRRAQRAYRIRGLNAAVWLVRDSTFLRYGGFDPLFFMYAEDDDLLDRWERHGLGFALVPAAQAAHARERSPLPPPNAWQRVSREVARLRSRRVLELKRLFADGRPGIRVLLMAGLGEATAEAMLRRSFGSWLAGVMATCSAVARARQVRAHAALCATEGPHFLDAAPSD